MRIIVLISVLALLLVGLFVVISLLRNGTIPREKVSFLPSPLVEWIVLFKKQVISRANFINRRNFYFYYYFGFVC